MAQTLNVVLTDPDGAGEQDLEIRDTDSFLLVRAPQDLRDLHAFPEGFPGRGDLVYRGGSTNDSLLG
ncbi:hypothetical protein Dvina_50000 [Dactylosporangium vinaceum]|uniref:Uncharacterized protein n=1 Tax=Dactylosporangium vinaceum TaxID=53362 RepID=A0ABV5M502_9ACTN|nr:hypothetical protein [Dactylosporangium vinaceum]UAB96009.1 hypothetical protein Dvina_50000 [Dactylosporangium vinaceum]